MYSIETHDLTKKFESLTAVSDLNIQVGCGEVFGLLGPNGAGKSTTLNILCTILKPTSGFAHVNGLDVVDRPHEVRQSIGIVFQDQSIDARLTGRENMHMHAELYEVDGKVQRERIRELLALVELEDRADDLVKTYSGGMRRRLEIARGLIHHPKVLFLDEPTIGLDPQTRAKIWDYVKKLPREEDITIIVTTHYMEEAQLLCDRVGIIDHGKLIAQGRPADMIRQIGEDVAYILIDDMSRAGEFKALDCVKKVAVGDKISLVLDDGPSTVPKIFDYAAKKNIRILSIELRTPTLNDVFLHYVGRELRPEHSDGKGPIHLRKRFAG